MAKIVRDAELGKRLADKLVKVWRLGGEEAFVLCHIEIQGTQERHFAERMFTYYHRIRERYDRPVASLAVLTDESSTWRPQSYSLELWGTKSTFQFPITKLLDYVQTWTDLEESTNPFATVVMAHLKALETRQDALLRKQWKFQLTRRLYEQGYQRQDILNLYLFIDWLLALPKDIEAIFLQDLEQYEQENQMPYVTTVERNAEERGRQEAQQETKAEIIPRLSNLGLTVDQIAVAVDMSVEEVQQLLQARPEDNFPMD